MKHILALVIVSFAASLFAKALEHPNDWRPAIVLMEPVCQVTDWNQTGPLNTYVALDKGYVCGCDPLAWGQILTYHALNHGFPAPDWEPKPYTGTVFVGPERMERTTMPGPYDWVAIRDKKTWKDETGAEVSPVGRLMWDLGAMGGTQYGGHLGTAGTVWPLFTHYFGYQGKGHVYTAPKPGGVLQPYWRGMLRRILRTSLQARAPLGAGINAHMIVADGWGVDEHGEEWFHVDYGWGSGSGKWWNLDKMVEMVVHLYPLVFPRELNAVVAGRVTDAEGKGVPYAMVRLMGAEGGGAVGSAVTDARGLYCITGVPRVDVTELAPPDALQAATYTLTAEGEGFLAARQTVTVRGFIDDGLCAQKQNAWEDAHGKEDPIVYPLAYGGAVADVTLQPVRPVCYVAPGGTGDGSSWATAAPLTQETLNAFAGREVRVAQGEYALTADLAVPENTHLLGGHDPVSGVRDPLAFPTTLRATGKGQNNYVGLGAGALLDGFCVTGSTPWANVLVHGEGAQVSTVRNCQLFGSAPKAAESVRLETSFVLSPALGFEACELLHCTLVGALPEGKDGVDLGGNRAGAALGRLRPTAAAPCAADHVCPTLGADGRPLGKALGALAPDRFGVVPTGYRLRVR